MLWAVESSELTAPGARKSLKKYIAAVRRLSEAFDKLQRRFVLAKQVGVKAPKPQSSKCIFSP